MFTLNQALLEIQRSQLSDWTTQGFGMLRMYPNAPGDYRLNFWHKAFRTAANSMTHNHPWHLRSKVLVGGLVNTRYLEVEPSDGLDGYKVYDRYLIKTGPGGGPLEKPIRVLLIPSRQEFITADNTYEQEANEIHETDAGDGTLTINLRHRVGTQENAYSYTPAAEEWQSAEPRATRQNEFEFMRRCLGLS